MTQQTTLTIGFHCSEDKHCFVQWIIGWWEHETINIYETNNTFQGTFLIAAKWIYSAWKPVFKYFQPRIPTGATVLHHECLCFHRLPNSRSFFSNIISRATPTQSTGAQQKHSQTVRAQLTQTLTQMQFSRHITHCNLWLFRSSIKTSISLSVSSFLFVP